MTTSLKNVRRDRKPQGGVLYLGSLYRVLVENGPCPCGGAEIWRAGLSPEFASNLYGILVFRNTYVPSGLPELRLPTESKCDRFGLLSIQKSGPIIP